MSKPRTTSFSLDGRNGRAWLECTDGRLSFCLERDHEELLMVDVDRATLLAWLSVQVRKSDLAAAAIRTAENASVADVAAFGRNIVDLFQQSRRR